MPSYRNHMNFSRFLLKRFLFEFLFLSAVAYFYVDLCNWAEIFTVFIVYKIVCLNLGLAHRCLRTLPRDLQGLVLLIKIKWEMWRMFRINGPISDHFVEVVRTHPEKECVMEVESGRRMNFREFNDHANRYANFFKTRGFAKDAVIALYLENGIDFFACWLGLSKLGVVTAWINNNLKQIPLSHSINISECSALVTTQAGLPAITNAISAGLLIPNLKIYLIDGPTNGIEAISDQLTDSSEPPPVQGLSFQSILCYIYTSGTTGNPKAAIIKHYRFYLVGLAVGYGFGIRPSDRLYITLPMYHSAGGILGVSQVIIRGCTACIRTRFSASSFWKDCVRFDCTVSQYIGEICRYLLLQKPCDEERRHGIRLMFGNGLRPEIWAQFIRRFDVKRIGEFYGSTEGNSNILNIDNHLGACGFMPIYPLLGRLYPVRLLKVDAETGELVRNARGFCVPCKPGDTGELVGTIRDDNYILRFEGYISQGETQKKVIRNATRPGDIVFTSGDILHWDKLGYFYFKDRRGDTYRWKGENVSTTEVEGVLQPIKSIRDATVFGVEVPGKEGRAGMIGVALVDGTDVQEFLREVTDRLVENLASYAIPLFIRICAEVDKTETFKLRKTALQRDGYDVERCAGSTLFCWDGRAHAYEPLTHQMQLDIDAGVSRI